MNPDLEEPAEARDLAIAALKEAIGWIGEVRPRTEQAAQAKRQCRAAIAALASHNLTVQADSGAETATVPIEATKEMIDAAAHYIDQHGGSNRLHATFRYHEMWARILEASRRVKP